MDEFAHPAALGKKGVLIPTRKAKLAKQWTNLLKHKFQFTI